MNTIMYTSRGKSLFVFITWWAIIWRRNVERKNFANRIYKSPSINSDSTNLYFYFSRVISILCRTRRFFFFFKWNFQNCKNNKLKVRVILLLIFLNRIAKRSRTDLRTLDFTWIDGKIKNENKRAKWNSEKWLKIQKMDRIWWRKFKR